MKIRFVESDGIVYSAVMTIHITSYRKAFALFIHCDDTKENSIRFEFTESDSMEEPAISRGKNDSYRI